MTCFRHVILPFSVSITECLFFSIACSDLDSYNGHFKIGKCQIRNNYYYVLKNFWFDILGVQTTPVLCSIIYFRDWSCLVVYIVIYGNAKTASYLVHEDLGPGTISYVLKLVPEFEEAVHWKWLFFNVGLCFSQFSLWYGSMDWQEILMNFVDLF